MWRNSLKWGVEAVDRIQMVRCHYLNNNKQIIARFHSFANRERVWKKSFYRKTTENKQLYVSEDFPAAITAERKQLHPILKAAKVIPEYHRKVTIINNKLKPKDRLYTVNTLNNLPTNVYVFGGITSRLCKHSNLFVRKFVYEHISYNTVEQAYQHKKHDRHNTSINTVRYSSMRILELKSFWVGVLGTSTRRNGTKTGYSTWD